MDIVGMKWNIYTSTIYYKRLQVTFTATLSRQVLQRDKDIKFAEMDIVGMKWNIYTATMQRDSSLLSRPDSDTKKVLKGKFMQRYPYDCSEIHHEVKDSLED